MHRHLMMHFDSDETYGGYGSDNPFLVKDWKEKYFLVKNTGDEK